jgi:hypothetical protein
MLGPIEEQRFAAYIDRPECPGSIVHLPKGEQSAFIGAQAPFEHVLYSYKILLPYHWSDARRIREVALYIAWMELRLWGYAPLDLLARPLTFAHTSYARVQEVADRLIAPRPWVEAVLPQARPSRAQIAQAASSLNIPTASLRTVLTAPASPEADAVHQRIKMATGCPWFLPPDLRSLYPADRW